MLLIEKSAHLRSHAGQPAFPGGGVDPGDDFPVGTALREARGGGRASTPPACGCWPRCQELFLPPSDRLVVPVVGWWDDPRDVTVGDPREVARVARVPLADLADPANRFRVRHPSGFVGPAFAVADMLVWGFTAGLLEAILEAAGLAEPWDERDVRPLPAVRAAPVRAARPVRRRRGRRRRRADGRRSRARRASDAYGSPPMRGRSAVPVGGAAAAARPARAAGRARRLRRRRGRRRRRRRRRRPGRRRR